VIQQTGFWNNLACRFKLLGYFEEHGTTHVLLLCDSTNRVLEQPCLQVQASGLFRGARHYTRAVDLGFNKQGFGTKIACRFRLLGYFEEHGTTHALLICDSVNRVLEQTLPAGTELLSFC
jgi:Fe2+ or Zn2+ uptake regulation protein